MSQRKRLTVFRLCCCSARRSRFAHPSGGNRMVEQRACSGSADCGRRGNRLEHPPRRGIAAAADAGLAYLLADAWRRRYSADDRLDGIGELWRARRSPGRHRGVFRRGGLETLGYENGVVLPIVGHARTSRRGAACCMPRWTTPSCKDICIPYHASLDLALPPGLRLPGPEASLIAAARAKVPGDLAAAQLKLLGAVVEPVKEGTVLSVRLTSSGCRSAHPTCSSREPVMVRRLDPM